MLLNPTPDQALLPGDDGDVPRRARARSTCCATSATTRPVEPATTGSAVPSSAGRPCSSTRQHGGGADRRARARRPHADRPRVRPPRRARAAGADERRRRAAQPSRWRRPRPTAVAALVAGTSTAAWCLAEPPPQRPTRGGWALDVRIDGDEVVLNGTKRPVDSAADRRPAPRHRPHRRRPHAGARARATRRASRSRRCGRST